MNCMNQNTLQALRQIMDAIDEKDTQFIRDLSLEEYRAFKNLIITCDAFIKQTTVLQDDYCALHRLP